MIVEEIKNSPCVVFGCINRRVSYSLYCETHKSKKELVVTTASDAVHGTAGPRTVSRAAFLRSGRKVTSALSMAEMFLDSYPIAQLIIEEIAMQVGNPAKLGEMYDELEATGKIIAAP